MGSHNLPSDAHHDVGVLGPASSRQRRRVEDGWRLVVLVMVGAVDKGSYSADGVAALAGGVEPRQRVGYRQKEMRP